MRTSELPSVAIVEADGIQQWILGASTELRVIRGGSLLLDRAFRGVEQMLTSLLGEPQPPNDEPPPAGWQLLVRSSGAMTFALAAGTDIDGVRDGIRLVLAREVPDLSTSFGAAPWTTSFSEARRSAIRAKRALHGFGNARHIPGTLPCSSCGSASGSRRSSRPGTDAQPWHLCSTCERRAGMTHDTVDAFPDGVTAEYDLGKIGAATPAGRWKGYVGVVSADGNAIGQRFARISGTRELAEESAELKRQVTTNVRAALESARDGNGGDAPLPVNLLMQAGDDIRMVLPAHVALRAAARLCDSQELPGCAGVVITHASTPFYDAHAHAEELLDREAKKYARQLDPQQPPPVVAFRVESGSRPMQPGENRDPITASPYRATDLHQLVSVARSLSASNSAIRKVCESLRIRGRVATREWGLFVARTSTDDRAALAELWKRFGKDLHQPWVTDDGRSPMGDLLLLRSLLGSEVAA